MTKYRIEIYTARDGWNTPVEGDNQYDTRQAAQAAIDDICDTWQWDSTAMRIMPIMRVAEVAP